MRQLFNTSIIDNFGVYDGYYGMFLRDKNGKVSSFQRYGRAVELVEVNETIETGEVFLKLRYEYGGETHNLTIPRDHLKRQELLKYASNGVDVFEHTVSALIKLLQAQENETEEYYYNHKFLGWDKFNGKDIFKSSLIDNSVLYSEYCGDYLINPTGSYDIWRSMIESEVIGNPEMELSLSIGLSSVIVGRSNLLIDGENLFIHLFGESSTGKTTAACLIASTAGSPDIKEDGLLRSWHLTFNALIKTLTNNFGYPIIFDEFGAYSGKNIDDLVYLLSTGREKGRMTSDINLKEAEGFRTTIVSTGEKSILEQCSSELRGLDTRLIELSNLQYTRSGK